MTMIDVLKRETAHLPQTDRDLIARRLGEATALARRFSTADEQALTMKLQSFGRCPRWVCVLIARAAIDARPAPVEAAAAASSLGIAINIVCTLPEGHLRAVEETLILSAFNVHYDPRTDEMTDEGEALRQRAEAIDLFLSQRAEVAS